MVLSALVAICAVNPWVAVGVAPLGYASPQGRRIRGYMRCREGFRMTQNTSLAHRQGEDAAGADNLETLRLGTARLAFVAAAQGQALEWDKTQKARCKVKEAFPNAVF